LSLGRRRLVRVPGSSANLGPGFDVLAAALALHLELEVVETGSFAVETELEIPRDRSNLVVRGFERLHPADAFEFRISSSIPPQGGAGASAAALVAGLVAADHIFELDADLLALAAELEGHPDNAAASLHGGLVICGAGGARRFDAPLGLEAILVVPHEALGTAQARAVLPESVPLTDAVANLAAVSALILGLSRGDWDLIAPLSPLGGADRAGAAAGCARGHDLGRRPQRAGVVPLRAHRHRDGAARARGGGLGARPAGHVRVAGGLRPRALVSHEAPAPRRRCMDR
jgi:homoserine kinase